MSQSAGEEACYYVDSCCNLPPSPALIHLIQLVQVGPPYFPQVILKSLPGTEKQCTRLSIVSNGIVKFSDRAFF